jgi:hypothetical protein
VDCHQELQTAHSTYTRLSRIHVHATRPSLVSTLAVLVRGDDQWLRGPAIVLIIDKSRTGCPPTAVEFYEPLSTVFPSARSGECILLKNFKVSWSRRNVPYLKSHVDSKWRIWRHAGYTEGLQGFGVEESAEMERLYRWWHSGEGADGNIHDVMSFARA